MATSTPSTTLGWKFNHIGIRVSDLEKSLHFYITVLGMKELSRIPLETVTIVHLGYAEDGQSDKALTREGVLELVYAQQEHPKKLITSTTHNPEFGFVKLTFTVPDMAVILARFKEHQIPLLKEPGDGKGVELAAQAIGITPDKERNKPLWGFLDTVAFLEDPDEYLIELIQY